MATVGILALQGDFEAHAKALRELGLQTREVRTASEITAVDGLVLPGGESSTHLKLIEQFELEPALRDFVETGKPVLATCAGLILAARHVSNPSQKSLGFLDISVARNAFGRQIHSFAAHADASDMPMVFIRAPRITEIGRNVEVMANYQGEPVLVRQNAVIGATFHPELARDRRVQRQAFKDLL
jgi:pyridoxal 5'-phosphate synthase pdxT subunit